jgi:hypothetical protein
MPVSLEERLLLRRLGMDPAFSNDLSTGGLYGKPDSINPGGLRMQQGTRDFRAMTDPNPTRMPMTFASKPTSPSTRVNSRPWMGCRLRLVRCGTTFPPARTMPLRC